MTSNDFLQERVLEMSSTKGMPASANYQSALIDQSLSHTPIDTDTTAAKRTTTPPLQEPNTITSPLPPAVHPLSPTLWPHHHKLTLTVLCCTVTFLTGWNATALTASTAQLNTHFHISDTYFPQSVWSITAWNAGAALAPMFVLPIMEERGTRWGYLGAYAVFLGFVIPQGLLDGYAGFCIVRFLAGCGAGVLQTSMDGVIADVWADGVKMSVPVSCYVGSLLAGVSSGPVFGIVVSEGFRWGWRGVVWGEVMIYAVLGVWVWVGFKETRVDAIVEGMERRERRKRRRREREEKNADVPTSTSTPTSTEDPPPLQPSQAQAHPTQPPTHDLKTTLLTSLTRPFILLLTEPVVAAFTLLSALSYGLTFLCTQSIPQVYGALYFPSQDDPRTSYIQASVVLGEFAGWAICMLVQDRWYARCARLAEASAPSSTSRRTLPEKRLTAAIPGCFIGLALGLFLYGFLAAPGVSIYGPTAGLFLLGVGVVVVMQAIMMYVTDAYGVYAASASAAVCLGENLFAAFLPLGSQGMVQRLGVKGMGGLLGGVAVVLGFVGPVVLVVWGERVRGWSRFMRRAAGEGEG